MIRRVIGVIILTTLLCAGTARHVRADPRFKLPLWDSVRRILPDRESAAIPPSPEVPAPPHNSAAPSRSDLFRASTTGSTGTTTQQASPRPQPPAQAANATEAGAGNRIRFSLWNKPPQEAEQPAPADPEVPAFPGLSHVNLNEIQPAGWEMPADVNEPIAPPARDWVTPLPDESDEIARPLFGEVLEDASRPTSIIQTDWDVEDWIEEEDFEPPEWLFWENDSPRNGFCRRLFGFGPRDPWIDIGIGRERVPFGTFEIDASQPWNNVRVRYDSVYSLPTPDRIQYFWAKSGNGPPSDGEQVDYQEFRIYSEVGGTSASVITEYPIRSVDPLFAGNTTGFGDMVVGNKAVMVDGRDWQITQVFRTYINTGSVEKGLGNGHVSMEPGVLGRYEWTEDTYVHGELKFWFPVGAADMDFSGQVLRYGIGLTHVGYDTDVFALIHSAEFVGMTFIDGQKTKGGTVDVDGETVGTWLYGMHFVLGPRGDLGLFEVGLAAGVGTGIDWYDGLFRLDFRWNY